MTGFTCYIAGDSVGYSGLETMPPLSANAIDKNLTDFFTYVPVKKISFAEGGMPLSATNLTRFANNTEIETMPDVLFLGNKV